MKRLALPTFIAASLALSAIGAVYAAGSTHKDQADHAHDQHAHDQHDQDQHAMGSTHKDHSDHDHAEHAAGSTHNDHDHGAHDHEDHDHEDHDHEKMHQGEGSATKDHEHSGSHSKTQSESMDAASGSNPSQPSGGQAAFAEIERIVMMLEADPNTDWSKVDIEGLRQHLIDMDNVVMRAQISAVKQAKGATYLVTSGDPAVIASIQHMAQAHGMMMGSAGYSWDFSMRDKGAVVTVTSDDPSQAVKIQALGFVGLLTLGGHHNIHHEMMARGHNPH